MLSSELKEWWFGRLFKQVVDILRDLELLVVLALMKYGFGQRVVTTGGFTVSRYDRLFTFLSLLPSPSTPQSPPDK